jgi:hypothetical protein
MGNNHVRRLMVRDLFGDSSLDVLPEKVEMGSKEFLLGNFRNLNSCK